MANARQAEALAREQLTAEIKEGVAREEAQELAAAARAAEPAPESAPQPDAERVRQEQARQEQARQAQARQQSDWQRLQNYLARASVEEQENNLDWRRYRQQRSQIPEFADQSGRLLQETFTKDPVRFQQLQQVAAADQQYAARAVELRNQRQAREVQANQIRAHHQRQQVAAYAEQEDGKFADWVASEMPEFSTTEGKKRLGAAAREVLKSTGLSDAEINQQWQSGHLRPFGFQRTIALAARWQMAQESMRDIRANRQPLPPVQKPGTLAGISRDGVDPGEIKRLQGRVSNARNEREALMASVELMKAKRGR
jgi:hypothetical protein